MRRHAPIHLVIITLLLLPLSGCKDTLERWLNEETYQFQGNYTNQYSDSTLLFRDGVVRMQSSVQTKLIPYRVDGTTISLRIRNNSQEKRADIIMRIHGDGEVLTCSACAKYNLSNVWVKDNKTVMNKTTQ